MKCVTIKVNKIINSLSYVTKVFQKFPKSYYMLITLNKTRKKWFLASVVAIETEEIIKEKSGNVVIFFSLQLNDDKMTNYWFWFNSNCDAIFDYLWTALSLK